MRAAGGGKNATYYHTENEAGGGGERRGERDELHAYVSTGKKGLKYVPTGFGVKTVKWVSARPEAKLYILSKHSAMMGFVRAYVIQYYSAMLDRASHTPPGRGTAVPSVT